MKNLGNVRLAGLVKESIVDGPGIRYTIFSQGCPHKCPGCHNPHTHDEAGGELMEISEILADIDKNPLLAGVTFSGGEPFLQADKFLIIAKEVKSRALNIIIYTGYIYEKLLKMAEEKPEILALLKESDFLIDGPFIEKEKDHETSFRGSKNQRIIDISKSLGAGETVLAEI